MNISCLVIIFVCIAASYLFFAFLIYRLPKSQQQKRTEGEVVFTFINANVNFRGSLKRLF